MKERLRTEGKSENEIEDIMKKQKEDRVIMDGNTAKDNEKMQEDIKKRLQSEGKTDGEIIEILRKRQTERDAPIKK
jgi:hypothetical protein